MDNQGAASSRYPLEIGFALAGTANLVPNVTRISALGINLDIDTGTQPEDVWAGSEIGLLNGYDHKIIPFMTTPTLVEIVSSSANDSAAGAGLRTVVVGYLDSTYTAKTALLTLNGLTPVALPEAVLAINSIIRVTSGTYRGANLGNISVRDVGGLGKTYSYAKIGAGIAQSSAFTVPAGYTLFVMSMLFLINSADTTARQAVMSFSTISASGALLKALEVGVSDATPYRHEAQNMAVTTVPEKSVILMSCDAVSQNNTNVTGAYVGYLIKNSAIGIP